MGAAWHRWSVRRLLAAGYLFAMGLLLLVGVSSSIGIGVLLRDRQPVEQSYRALATISAVQTHVQDAERGQRGFLITGSETYLAPYQVAIADVEHTIRELEAMTADDPVEQHALEVLRPALTDKLSELAQTIQLRREQGFDAAREVVLTDRGARAMTVIEQQLDAMRTEENRLLRARQDAAAGSGHDTQWQILLTTVAGGALVGAGAWWTARTVSRPVMAVAAAARRVTAGHLAGRAPVSGPTEIAEMAVAVNAATDAIVAARDEAVAASAAKAAFLATMSHEIRTPMNAVIGMTGLLMDTTLTKDQWEFVGTIRDSGEALLVVINDILDFSKIESGQLCLEDTSFDIRECLDSALALLAVPADRKGLELVGQVCPGCPAVLRGDATRLRQILVNLLSNAVKFTDRGEVAVTIDAEPADADRLRLKVDVRDTGIGIPADRMDRLFRSFSQVDASTTRTYGGTGLGLAISRSIAHAMDGDLTVTSQEGVGSTFTLTVLLHRGAPTDRHATPATLAGRRALVVDDNATNRTTLRAQLTEWGMRCINVASAAEALDLLSFGARFDVALLDMHMPDMDGVALAAAVRKLPQCQALPLVLLSSVSWRPQPHEQHLFNAVATKPVRATTLMTTLTGLLATAATTNPPDEPDEPDEPEPAAPAPPPPWHAPLRVLLAEDNPVNQRVAQLLLAKLGHRVDTVGNGREAIEALHRAPYDVLLMDVNMPVLDGLAATRLIRTEFPAGQQPHIIAITAGALEEDRAACRAAGMNDYLAKPIRAVELAAALTPLLLSPNPAEPDPPHTPREAAVRARMSDLIDPDSDDAERRLIAGLLLSFNARVPDMLNELLTALDQADATRTADAAHAFRGAAANLGADHLAVLLAEPEEDARHGNPPDRLRTEARLRDELHHLQPILNRIAAELHEQPPHR